MLRLEPHIRINLNNGQYLKPNNIQDILYGLKNIQDCLEVRILLATVVLHINYCTQKELWLSATNLSHAVHGLQNIPNCGEVRGILRALLPHIQKIAIDGPVQFDAKAFGLMLFGLKTMRASPSIDALLTVISPRIQGSALDWQANYGDSLKVELGLRDMHDSNPALEILSFFKAIVIPKNATEAVLIPENIRNADPERLSYILFDYRKIAASSHIIAILNDIPSRIQELNTVWTAKQVSQAVCGLREMEDSEKAVTILKALTKQVDSITFSDAQLKNYAPWLAGEIYSVMYYLMNPHTLNEAKAYLIAIGLHLNSALTAWDNPDVNDPQKIIKAHEKLGSIFYQFQQEFLDKMKVSSLPTQAYLLEQMAWLCGYDFQQDEMELDLHFCTYPMAKLLSTYTVANFIDRVETEEGFERSLDIIFGISSHNPENEGEMEEVVNQVLSNLNDKIWLKKNHENRGLKMIRFEPISNPLSPVELSLEELANDTSSSENSLSRVQDGMFQDTGQSSSEDSEEAELTHIVEKRFAKRAKKSE